MIDAPMPTQIKPSVIAFDIFGTLVKIGERRSPYKRLMKWMKNNGRKPDPNDAAMIMSNLAGFKEIAAMFGMTIPAQLLTELNNDLSYECFI